MLLLSVRSASGQLGRGEVRGLVAGPCLVPGPQDAAEPDCSRGVCAAGPQGLEQTGEVTGNRRGARADRRRAMYAGGRPDEAARVIHRRFAAGPLPRVLPVAAVLDVRGRISGATVHVPLATVRYRGSWYLVSMLGEQSNWVRNVRAAGGSAVLTHGRRRPVRLVEVPVAERAPIIRRYLTFALGARPHIAISWRAPLSAFEQVAGHYPVFQVTPAARDQAP